MAKTTLSYLVALLTAEVPGCRKCADPAHGPLMHEHNAGDCRWTLGQAVLDAREDLLFLLKTSP
jgi:hypothetical protein